MKPFASLEERKEFIKAIAKRNKREDDYIRSLNMKKAEDDEEYLASVQSEFEALKKRSIKLTSED